MHSPRHALHAGPEAEVLLPHANHNTRSANPAPNFSMSPTALRGRPRWLNPHPFWLIPVVLVMSMSRGITMSPRIQVYKAIACRVLASDELLDPTTPRCGEADVQARAARIQASVVTTMSVLSAISTGFWSRLGDRHGRKPILVVFLIGALTMEAVFLLVMREGTIFSRYGERFILLGPILEGSVGAIATFNGVVHAYVSDCTRPGSRSKIFSTVQGIVFVGLSMGPWAGGLFLPKTGYNPSFFYASIGLILLTITYVLLALPESRFPPPESTPQPSSSSRSSGVGFKSSPVQAIRTQVGVFVKAVLSPIAMFAPRVVLDGRGRGKGAGRDWNMTFVGLGLFIYLVSIGVYSAKYLYAQHVYSWTTAQLGYYMSILWISRAFNLLVFLPIVISYLKPKPTTPPGYTSPNAHDIGAELTFDKRLAQISLAVDGLADALVALISAQSQATFTVLSCLASFTSGGNPALHSLGAVCLHACGYGGEVGALFGAMAVLSAVAHIISPSIYALTYASTVARFPQAIFVLAAVLLFSGVLLLSRVRPVEGDIALINTPRGDEEEAGYAALADAEDDGASEEFGNGK